MIGTTVGSYQVKQRLGQGGVGSVYRVEHTVLGTMHALKVLTLPHERSRLRLLAEGQIQARLKHPNLVAVRDVVDVGGQPGLILDLVEGPTLARLLQAGPLPVSAIGSLGTGILKGMARAHQEGLVHRDLKPENVLVEVGEGRLVPKVADFGLARDGGQVHGVTASGASLGTPRYMAPEQVRDPRDVDLRSDVWALGVVLYELCCGHPPFDQPDLLALYGDIAAGRYLPLGGRRPGLPQPWLDAVEAALQVDRAARPADAGALLDLWGAVDDPVPEAVLATARSLCPAMVDDPVPEPTWGGVSRFDSQQGGAPHPTGSQPPMGSQLPATFSPPSAVQPPTEEAPGGGTPPPAPLAPLPPSLHAVGGRPGPSGVVLGAMGLGAVAGLALALAVTGAFLLARLEERSAPPPVSAAPPQAPSSPSAPPSPEPSWPGSVAAAEAAQALLDGDAASAVRLADFVVAGAPGEEPQLVLIAGAAALARYAAAWEEVERGRGFGLDPVQGALADALGDPEAYDEALLATASPFAVYARLRMGPRHPGRDAELLDALEGMARGRRLVPLARAQAAMGRGELDGARGALDRALEGDDVPELVRVYDALWYLYADDLPRAAAVIDGVFEEEARPSALAWMVRAEIDARLGREVKAATSGRRFRGSAWEQALRELLRVDGLLAEGDGAAALARGLAAEATLRHYASSPGTNVLRFELLTELARLGALAKDRAVVVKALAGIRALEGDPLPPSRGGELPVRRLVGEALLASVDGRRGPAEALLEELEDHPITEAVPIQVLRDVLQGAPLRVWPALLP